MDRLSALMPNSSRRLWRLIVEREEDFISLYADLLCLVGGRNCAS